MSGIIASCKIKVNAAGDWQVLPPAGQITQIGNAGATSNGLVADDDLFVSGKFECDGEAYFDGANSYCNGILLMNGEYQYIKDVGRNNSQLHHHKASEQLTIAIGTGAAGVNTVANLAPANSIINAIAVRVTQAPGGGATEFDLGRTGGNLDEFIDGLAVALGTQGTSAANSDGVNPGPVHNAANNTFTLTTDANVTVSDMKVRICVYSREINAPTS